MKQLFMMMAMLMISALSIKGQEQVEDFSYFSENVVDKKIGLPIVRPIYGGTKIIPTFVGNWTKEMEGAFEYACRIWEEAMPTTFPVKIDVILDDNSSVGETVFSKAGFNVVDNTKNSFNFVTPSSPWSQIKANNWLNQAGVFNEGAFYDFLTPNMFYNPEMTIIYYNYGKKLEKECSFSLGETIDDNHYDFVTMALRDIARAFGIIWRGNVRTPGSLNFLPTKLTPFESNIVYVIGKDPQKAYTKATTERIFVGRIFGNSPNCWELYSPSTWDNSRSLNYFIPNASQKITNLLSYEFGKGTVVRDIASEDTYKMFSSLLGWTGTVAVSIGNNGTGCSERKASTESVLPFKGTFTSSANRSSKPNTCSSAVGLPLTKEEIPDYIKQFIPKADKPIAGIGVSFLKDDGTWDEVYYEPGINDVANIDVREFQLHDDIDNYARSCDGHIRCRVMIYTMGVAKMYASVYYYLLDYLPQTVQLAKSATISKPVEDEYLRTVKIGIKNIEGVTKIVVAQLDEDNELPYYYEVKDFKKGYFEAVVDRDYTSTFTITAYNKNGSTESYPYVLNPVDPSPVDVKFCLKNQNINILTSRRRTRTLNDENLISKVKINSLETNEEIKLNRQNRIDEINISPLPKGHYVLTVYDVYERKHVFKFSR